MAANGIISDFSVGVGSQTSLGTLGFPCSLHCHVVSDFSLNLRLPSAFSKACAFSKALVFSPPFCEGFAFSTIFSFSNAVFPAIFPASNFKPSCRFSYCCCLVSLAAHESRQSFPASLPTFRTWPSLSRCVELWRLSQQFDQAVWRGWEWISPELSNLRRPFHKEWVYPTLGIWRVIFASALVIFKVLFQPFSKALSLPFPLVG